MKLLRCTKPETGSLLWHYKLNVLKEGDRDRFEEHLLECDFCAREMANVHPITTAFIANRENVLAGLDKEGISFDGVRQQLVSQSKREKKTNAIFYVWERIMNLPASFKRPTLRWMISGASACAVIAVVAYLIISPPPSNVSPQYVPYLNFKAPPYEGSLTLRGDGALPGKEYFDQGMDAYLQADYPKASGLIRRALNKSPDQAEWWLYLGICRYLQRNPDKAIDALERADELAQGGMKIRARWFLGQSCLLKGDRTRAETLLEWIVLQNKDYSADSFRLLSILRENGSQGNSVPKTPSVTTPSGGEIFLAGTAIDISWNDDEAEAAQQYQIWLSIDGGVTFPKLLVSGIPIGQTDWQWLDADIISSSLSLQVSRIGEQATSRGSGSRPFTVTTPPTIKIWSPDRGDRWRFGAAHTINWTVFGTPPLACGIELYRIHPPDTEWVGTLASYLPGSTTSWMWKDTANEYASEEPGDDYRIKVTGVFSAGQVEDWNTGKFSLAAAAEITVNPITDDGILFTEGNTAFISWQNTQTDVRSYSIQLSPSAYSDGQVLASDLPPTTTEWIWNNAGPTGTFFIRVIAHFSEGDIAGYTPLDIAPNPANTLTHEAARSMGQTARGLDSSPAAIDLKQNYPNPFNAVTTISFDLTAPANVKLSVFNAVGQAVTTLVDGSLSAGHHVVQFDGRALASGMYIYRLECGGQALQKSMLLTK